MASDHHEKFIPSVYSKILIFLLFFNKAAFFTTCLLSSFFHYSSVHNKSHQIKSKTSHSISSYLCVLINLYQMQQTEVDRIKNISIHIKSSISSFESLKIIEKSSSWFQRIKNLHLKKFLFILFLSSDCFHPLIFSCFALLLCMNDVDYVRSIVFISFKVSCTNISNALHPQPLVHQPLWKKRIQEKNKWENGIDIIWEKKDKVTVNERKIHT
jgi:hypothetical protein